MTNAPAGAVDAYAVYRPLLDLTEGTDKGDGYNETLAYGAYGPLVSGRRGRRERTEYASGDDRRSKT